MKRYVAINAIAAALLAGSSIATAAEVNARDYQTSRGELTVTYGQPDMPPAGPPPPFGAIDANRDGFISLDEAHSAYYMLYNDFDHADYTRDHRVSSKEYAVWLREPI
jgi:hypothetical protein